MKASLVPVNKWFVQHAYSNLILFSPFLRPIRSDSCKMLSPSFSTKSLSSAPYCKRITANSELSLSKQIFSGDLLLLGRPLARAFFPRRVVNRWLQFSSSHFRTKSSGTQEASQSVAQDPLQKSVDRFSMASVFTDSVINFSTKYLGTGTSASNTWNAVEDRVSL